MKRSAFLLVGGLLCGATVLGAEDIDPVSVDAQVWTERSFTGDETKSLTPGGRICVDGPVVVGADQVASLYVSLDVTSMSQDVPVDFANAATIGRYAELGVWVGRKIGEAQIAGQKLRSMVVAGGAVATALDRNPTPLNRYPRRVEGGVRLEERTTGSYLQVTYGRNEVVRPQSFGAGQMTISAQVLLDPVIVSGDFMLDMTHDGRGRDFGRVRVGLSASGVISTVNKLRHKDGNP